MRCGIASARSAAATARASHTGQAKQSAVARPKKSAPAVRRRVAWRPIIAAAAAAAPIAFHTLSASATDVIWNGGSGAWSTASQWSTGTAPNAANVDVYIDGGNGTVSSSVLLDLANIATHNLTIDAGDSLSMPSTSALLFGNLSVNGSLSAGNRITLFGGPLIDGAGSIQLTGASADVRNATTNAINIGSSLLMHGAGTLEDATTNGGGYVNFGTISADLAGGAIQLNHIDNRGTLSAVNGGSLVLGGGWQNHGAIQLIDSSITFNGAYSTDLFAAMSVSGSNSQVVLNGAIDNTGRALIASPTTGNIQTNGVVHGGTVAASGGRTLTLSGSVDGVTIASDVATPGLQVFNGLTLTNNATLQPPTLLFSGTGAQKLDGAGQIVMSAPASRITNYSPGPIAIGPGILIHGSSGKMVGQDYGGGFVNQGTISADAPGPFGAPLEVSGLVNYGTLQAINGGNLGLFDVTNNGILRVVDSTLTLEGSVALAALGNFSFSGSNSAVVLTGVLDNSSQVLNVTPALGNTWTIRDAGGIRGGTVTASAGKLIIGPVQNGITDMPTLDSVTLQTDLSFLPGGQLLIKNGLILASATIDAGGGGGNNSQIIFGGTASQTIGGNGTINASGVTLHVDQNATLGPGITLHGESGNWAGAAPLTNRGTMAVSTGAVTCSDGDWTNFGLIEATSGGSLSFKPQGSNPVRNGGTILASTGGSLYINNLQNQPAGSVLVADASSSIFLDGAWSNQGSMTISGGTVILGGAFSAGDIGNLTLSNGGTLRFSGKLTGGVVNLDATGSWRVALAPVYGPPTPTFSGGATVTSSLGNKLLIEFANVDGATFAADAALMTQGASLYVGPGGLRLAGSTIDLSGGLATGGGAGSGTANGVLLLLNSTLTGNGQIVFGAQAGSQVAFSGTNFSVAAGILVRGQNGTINPNALPFVNYGTVSADVSVGNITIWNVNNVGTIRALNGGAITLQGAWQNSGGAILVSDAILNLGGTFSPAVIGSLARSGASVVNLTGTLQLPPGGSFTLDDVSGSWNLVGGAVQGASTAAATVSTAGSAQFILPPGASGSFSNVTLNAAPVFGNGSTLGLSGLVTLNGTVLDLSSAGSTGTNHAGITINGTMAGAGQVILGASGSDDVRSAGSGGTIGAGIIIRGNRGIVHGVDGVLTNFGTVLAEVPGGTITLSGVNNQGTVRASNGGSLFLASFTNNGTVLVDGGGPVTLGDAWVNNGTVLLNASPLIVSGTVLTANFGNFSDPGGTVRVQGTLVNTGRTLSLDSSITQWLLSGGTLRGGTVSSTAGASLFVGSNGGTLDSVTLNGVTAAFSQSGTNLTIANGLTLTNGARLDPAGGTNGFYGNILFTGTSGIALGGIGELSIGSNGSNTSALNNSNGPKPLTIGPGILIHGKNASIGPNTALDGGFINQGTILADVAGGTFTFRGRFTNQGTIQALNGGALSLQGTAFIQTAGALRSPGDVPNAGLLQISGGSASLGSLSGTTGSTILGNTTPGPAVPMTLSSFVQSSLTIHNTGVLTINPSPTRLTSSALALSIDGAGTLDLANAELLTASTPATIKSYLASAYGPNQDWSGPGLTSAVARTNSTNYSLAYAAGSDLSAQDAAVKLHDGSPLPTNQTVVRVTLTGDANLDGVVDFFDLSQLLGYKYNTAQPASYTDGDLNYDGKVDFFDITTLLSANYNTGQTYLGSAAQPSAQRSSAATTTPEPTLIALPLALASAALGRRRRPSPK
jgi:hypothetical protein